MASKRYNEVLSAEDEKKLDEIMRKYKFGGSLIIAYCNKENLFKSWKIPANEKIKVSQDARENDMTVSAYVVALLEKIVDSQKYLKYDFSKMLRTYEKAEDGETKERESLGITFPNDGELYEKISSICTKYMVKEIRFIRYVIMNEKL